MKELLSNVGAGGAGPAVGAGPAAGGAPAAAAEEKKEEKKEEEKEESDDDMVRILATASFPWINFECSGLRTVRLIVCCYLVSYVAHCIFKSRVVYMHIK